MTKIELGFEGQNIRKETPEASVAKGLVWSA